VHFAEVVTTAFSGLSHIKFGNVDWRCCCIHWRDGSQHR
jgi:uncharacterized membrane protein YfcA